MPTAEDREGMAFYDGKREGHIEGYAAGYRKAWQDAKKVVHGWAWVEKLPPLKQAPEIPTEPRGY